MNTSGEVADLMAKEAIQVTEESVKLIALGAKNLAAIIMALVKEDNKLQGKTNLKNLLKAEKPLCIMQIKEDDLKKFQSEAKKYGVLFTAVSDKTNDTGLCDIIAKQDDVTKLNYIMEKMGYAAPVINEQDETEKSETADNKDKAQSKNSTPRTNENQSGGRYTKRGDTERTDSNFKPSVKRQINDIKAQQAKKQSGRTPVRQKSRTVPKKTMTKER